MTLREVSLADRLSLGAAPLLLNGNQALVRALLLQRERDRRAGLNTAGFVSGYRGSPLGGLDHALWSAGAALKAADVHFEPGVNEELAATAVWGTQQLTTMGDAAVDGVFGLWYGKGPGVDRAGDALKHGNYAGTHAHGGVLVVAGDDHPGKSSTVAHHSQQALAAHSIPVLYPADVAEFQSFALLGWALSRHSGCWVGLKTANETVEQAMTCIFDLDRFRVQLPHGAPLPPEGIHYRGAYAPAQDEILVRRHRLPRVLDFARANALDTPALGRVDAPFGIVAPGKNWHDVRLALRSLGLEHDPRVAVWKVGLVWPLEPRGLTDFAAGKRELLVVEDKTAFVETQAAAILYPLATRPRLTGKTDGAGAPLLNSDVGVEALELALIVAARLQANGLDDETLRERVRTLQSARGALLAVAAPAEVRRTPYFCSGCPHNTSTKIPEGSKALAGIGCHGMALYARPNTLVPTQMGGEGAQWVGLHRFTKRRHVFQNLGDGTYYHSGLLAIRAAVASGANITYKILYNDAVAMTGGQPVDGPISPAQIAHQVAAEGVRRIVLVSDDPARHRASDLPLGTRIERRDRLDIVQRELRDTAGCTVLLYEQTCAAEKRRRRKRAEMPDPDRRLFINEAVCEGCGDCSVQSTCVGVEPVDTPLGRKRRVNQSSCNKDFSCQKGFCPSFVTVVGGQPMQRAASLSMPALPEPPVARLGERAYGVMIPGIGGTGVITVGAVLAMSAHLEGKAAATYDMTGLSQKNGAVYCHLQVASDASRLGANRLGLGDADLLLGTDLVAALGDEAYRTLDPARSRLVGNLRVLPTAMQALSDQDLDAGTLTRKLGDKLGADRTRYLDASGLATVLMGDVVFANFMLVGAALQLGWLPVGAAALQRAIELNGVQVERNLRALSIGRMWVHDQEVLEHLLVPAGERSPQTLDEVIAHRRAWLTAYQDDAYADRYARFVQRVREAEQAAGGNGRLAMAVARHLAKLMAYKDEYEVARLYSEPAFHERLASAFDGVRELRLNLAPPLWARTDLATGRPVKREYGAWVFPCLRWLSKLKRLRGTAFDPFGRTAERRAERALVEGYMRRIDRLLPELNGPRLPLAVRIAEVADRVRGFGPLKEQSMSVATAMWSALDAEWKATRASADAIAG
ncbi:MAG: indolepyruvate ferredoxin oxidoreductase family protein [Rubrivivax sp.]|nr:indolepyruvate ferredoxin oxidoreductase family protein [Rubrivivax sp.]